MSKVDIEPSPMMRSCLVRRSVHRNTQLLPLPRTCSHSPPPSPYMPSSVTRLQKPHDSFSVAMVLALHTRVHTAVAAKRRISAQLHADGCQVVIEKTAFSAARRNPVRTRPP